MPFRQNQVATTRNSFRLLICTNTPCFGVCVKLLLAVCAESHSTCSLLLQLHYQQICLFVDILAVRSCRITRILLSTRVIWSIRGKGQGQMYHSPYWLLSFFHHFFHLQSGRNSRGFAATYLILVVYNTINTLICHYFKFFIQ